MSRDVKYFFYILLILVLKETFWKFSKLKNFNVPDFLKLFFGVLLSIWYKRFRIWSFKFPAFDLIYFKHFTLFPKVYAHINEFFQQVRLWNIFVAFIFLTIKTFEVGLNFFSYSFEWLLNIWSLSRESQPLNILTKQGRGK